MADGKVTIDTAIDSNGLKAGSKELEAAVKDWLLILMG